MYWAIQNTFALNSGVGFGCPLFSLARERGISRIPFVLHAFRELMSLSDTPFTPTEAPALHQGRDNADLESGVGLSAVKGSQEQKYDEGRETLARLPQIQSNDIGDSPLYGSAHKITSTCNNQEVQTDQIELNVATHVTIQELGSGIEGVHLSKASAGDPRIIGGNEAMYSASVKAAKSLTLPTTQDAQKLPPSTQLQSSVPTSGVPLSMHESAHGHSGLTSLKSPHEASSAGTINKRVERTSNGGKNKSQSEIHTIMEQFDDGGYSSEDQETVAPERGLGLSLLTSPFKVPPRKSSLEPLQSLSKTLDSGPLNGYPAFKPERSYANDLGELQEKSVASARRSPSLTPRAHSVVDPCGSISPRSSNSFQKSLPPVPDPEPDLPFDFHRFLEQLRHRTADPVAKFLRSFLIEFGKKQWMVHEQVKIISDFLVFITNKMAQCEIWRDVSDAEFDNAKEGMEKLVMNRLYTQTFSPAIPPPVSAPVARGKRKTVEKPLGPGRRGQHQEDIERDDVLAQKVRIYGWVREEHLDIAPVGDSGRRFLLLAQQGIPICNSIVWLASSHFIRAP